MRLKPRVWFLISLLLFTAAICVWQYGDKYAAEHRPVEKGRTDALRLQHPPLAKTVATNAVAKRKSYRISNTTQTIQQLLHNNHALILRNALIDTEVPVALNIPAHLRAKGAPGSYLVQADRPLDKAFYAELSKAGASYISYVPNNAALVAASPAQATNLAANADVVAVLPYEPYYKLDGTLLPSAVEQQPQTNALSVTTFPGQRDATLAALTQLGATLIGEDRSPFGPTLIVKVPSESLVAVAQLPLAQEIEAYTPRRIMNDLTRVIMGVSTDTLIGTSNYLGLSGLNVTVNMNDTGVDAGHPDLANRLLADYPSSLTDGDGHGTHVAGIIAGNGSKSSTVTNFVSGSITTNGPSNHADFRGKATNATLFVQALDLVSGPYVSDAFLQENASTNLGPTNLISNNSWGYATPANQQAGVYDIHAASFDAATRDAQPNVDGEQPLLFVFAAGNNGNGSDTGTDGVAETITSPATAKNVITVGASDSPRFITNMVSYDGVTTNEVFYGSTDSSDLVAWFSSCGNVGLGVEGTYGRYKPDVVAPGVFTISCRAADYVEPTIAIYVTDDFYTNTVALNQTNIYPLIIPEGTSQLVIMISSNAASPVPFPANMLLLGDPFPTEPPTDVLATNNYLSLSNFLSQEIWFFGVVAPSNSPGPVEYSINFYLIETNGLGDYFTVLSNMDNALKPYYRYDSGTSMSAGAVSGTLALMQEFLQTKMGMTNPSPALLKAMLINGSRSLGLQYDFNVNTEGANEQGWGLPNITNSIPSSLTNGLAATNTSMLLIDQSATSALATGQYQTYTINCLDTNASNAYPMRITLVWTDPPGNPTAGVALVNNLDLTVADATGTNIYIGNDFLSGDIFTEASNPTNLPPGQSDNAVQNIYVTNGVPTFTAAGDSINNVQNVYINPANVPITFPLTVTISGTRVNVNAVPGQTNNIVQDYALVISSDDPALTSSLTIQTNPMVTVAPVLVTVASNGVPLLHQRVGANEPNLYSYPLYTNGNASQWHFFVFTNTQWTNGQMASNVAFATFMPPNLSIPRNSGADIDLYVSTNPGLTNLIDSIVQAADKSLGRTGTKSIIYSNSFANEVYYIGVKSEDQQAADFGFYTIAQQAPFSTTGGNGSITATGTSLPVFIPNSLSPVPALVFAFVVNPNPLMQQIRRVTVTEGVQFPTPGNLYGTLQHNGLNTVLNNFSGYMYGFTNTYDDLQEDPNSGDILSDGPGSLKQYVGQTMTGLWLLSEANDDQSLTGFVTDYTVTVDPHQPVSGFFVTIGAGDWFDDYILVPNDATNLIISAIYENDGTNIAGSGPIGIYLTNFDNLNTSDYGSNNISPPGGSLTLGTNNPVPGWLGSPPLAGGTWYYGIYNSGQNPVTLYVEVQIEESLTPNLVQTYTNNTYIPLTTDAHTQSQICITNGQQVVSLQIGVRINDTNLDDLVLHLTSPEGTSVLLFEDRGGTISNSNLGETLVTFTTNGATTNVTTNYTTNIVYTVFTEDTNLATIPIKFAPPPFADEVIIQEAVLWSNSFETVTNGVYTNGAILEGWLVTNDVVAIQTTNGTGFLTNDEVGIVTDPNGDQFTNSLVTNSLGTNYLALTSGHIAQTFGATNILFTSAAGFNIMNGQPYQLQFYAKPPGIVSWWPGDGNTDDIIGTNNGALSPSGASYASGKVGLAFRFDGTNGYVQVPDSPTLKPANVTIEAWVWLDPKLPSNNGGEQIVFKKNTQSAWFEGYSLSKQTIDSGHGTSSDRFQFVISSPTRPADQWIINSQTIAQRGVWYHVAATYDGNQSILYVNGAAEASATPGFALDYDTTPLFIGTTGTWAPYLDMFGGIIDEISLYNRPLSPAEIYAIYHAGSLGKYSTNSILPNFDLTIDGISTNNIILTNASGGWQLFTNTFTANSGQVSVEFSGNPLGVLLDDIQLIQLPATNYNNYYLPEEPLTPFVGENPLGCWTLDVWDTRDDSPNPTDGELLSWTMQVTTSSTNATLYVLTNDVSTTITNATVNGMTYFAVDVPSYATYATNILTASSGGPLTLFFDQTALPTGGLPGDVTLINGVLAVSSSTNVLATEGAPPPLLPGQRYFLGVQNNGPANAAFSIEVDFNGLTNIIIPLTNAVAVTNLLGTNTIGTNGLAQYYSFLVPTNAIMVTFQILNPTNGEVDLYARDGLPVPDPLSFDYESRNAGTNDQFIVVTTNSVPVALPVASTNDVLPLLPGTWYLAACNFAAVSNVGYTIIATVVTNGAPGFTIIPLTNALPYTNNNTPPGYPTNLFYSFTVTNSPSGIQFLVTNLDLVGNVELLADLDVFPTPEESYFGSFNAGTNAQIIQIVPNAALPSLDGVWYLAVPNTSATNVPYSITAITNFIIPPPIVSLTWSGAYDNYWDILTTSNWVVTGSNPVTNYPYQNGSPVTFDDSATGPTTVNLTTTLSPASMTVNNAARTYNFIGSGSITGTTGLVKANSGMATFTETGGDNFSGGITMEGGILKYAATGVAVSGGVVNNAGTLILDQSGTISGGTTINAGTVQVGNNDATGSLPFGGVVDNGTLAFSRTDSFTYADVISGNGSLSQIGTGTLSLSGLNTYNGATFISGGTLVVDNTNALGSWNGGAVTVASGCTLDLSGLAVANGPADSLFGAKQFNISGAGAGGNGAIVNNGPFQQQGGFQNISLNADAAIGGFTRWDMRNEVGANTLNLNNFTLTKTGSNQISLVSSTVSSGNIIINQGILSVEATPQFTGSGVITVNSNGLVGQNQDTPGSFTCAIVLNGGGTTNLSGGGITYLDAPIQLSNNSSLGNGAGIEVFNGVISGAFGLTNLGGGSNLLSATNTYSGATFIAQGTLALTNNGSITNSTTITVASGAALDASQRADQTLTLASNQTLFLLANGTNLGDVVADAGSTVFGNGFMSQDLTLNDGSTCWLGPDGVTIGALTVGGTAALGGTNYMKINETLSPSNDVLTASNVVYGGTLIVTNLNTNGATTFVLGDSFTLYNTTNSTNAFINLSNLSLPSLPAGLAWSNTFASSGPGILSVVSNTNTNSVPPLPIVPLTWSGAVNGNWDGNWDILTTSNWVVTGSDPVTNYPYQDGSVVTFDDSATGTTTVNLTTALSPASIFVTNVYLSYIFTGSGGISGAPLTISGPLTLDNAANRFSSVALISGGMLQLGNNDAKGSLATSGGILGAGTFTNDGTLIFDRSDNVVVTNIIAGSGGLSQIGPDQLTLTGANTYTNATSVTAGTLALGPGGSIGGSAVTVSSGATLANATTGAVAIGGTTTFNPGAWASFTALGSGIVGPINVTGDLALNGNGIIVNVTGSTLGLGSYRLMNCTGTLTGSAGPATITGIALASGYIATISTTAGIAGHVDLVVNRAPAFSGLIASPSITYGASNITLSGTVSFASGGTTIYAANGDMVSATINGQTVNGTVSGASGGFSITYNDPSLQTDGVNGSPYTITYFYAGNSSLFLNSAVNTSTSLKVQPLPVILAGSRLYDGTATAAASILSVVNAINSDVVKVASGSCTLAGTNVGVEAITSFGSLVLGGAAAANYTLAGASGSVTIIAAPPFSITSGHIDNTGHNIIITWQSVPGTVYQVIAQTNVSAPLSAWTNVGNPIAAINTNTSATNPITQVWDFFAVKNAGASSPVVSGAFSITSGYIDSTGSNIVITWQSTVNAVYHVIAQTNISAPLSAWTNVGNAITATNTSTSATNPVTQPLNFFRVRSP